MDLSSDLLLRLLSLCLALAGAETLHGLFRAVALVPRIGKLRAQQVSIVTGSALAFGICCIFVPGIGLERSLPLLAVGFVLALFMAAFDVAIAKLVMRRSWARVAEDFDPRSGNYLAFGLAALVFMPLIVMSSR